MAKLKEDWQAEAEKAGIKLNRPDGNSKTIDELKAELEAKSKPGGEPGPAGEGEKEPEHIEDLHGGGSGNGGNGGGGQGDDEVGGGHEGSGKSGDGGKEDDTESHEQGADSGPDKSAEQGSQQEGKVEAVRAKFQCYDITDVPNGEKQYHFCAVAAGSEENKSFAQFTPIATLFMTVSEGTRAHELFEINKEFYIDFSRAE